MSEKRPQHPSGRPISRPKCGIRSIWRIPDEGPVTPGLQKKEGAYAVGFTARICPEDDED